MNNVHETNYYHFFKVNALEGKRFQLTALSSTLLELLDDEDDVLVALADQLSQLVDSVGGTEYAYYLLTPLENLSTVEDPSVREHVCV